MALLSALCGLFGCSKAPEYTPEDIRSVSVSCGHMDYSHSYSFYLRKTENGWLFDARCFVDDHHKEVAFENRDVSNEDMKTLFEILERNDSIAYAENYKKPKKLPFEVMDETTYSFCLTFSDGSQYTTCDWQKELEEFFYRLAENTD